MKTIHQKYYRGNKESQKTRNREYYRRLRAATLNALGGKCAKCGFTDVRALQIDHINGGGTIDPAKRGIGGNFCKQVMDSFLKNEGKYQLLCANCNWVKRAENNEVFKGVRALK